MYGTTVECSVCMEWGYLVDSGVCLLCLERKARYSGTKG